jgi:hypothetical protein
VYGEIMNIMEDALQHNVFLTSTFCDRSLTLNHLAQRVLSTKNMTRKKRSSRQKRNRCR